MGVVAWPIAERLRLLQVSLLLRAPVPRPVDATYGFRLTSFVACVVESAGQQMLNTESGSGDAFGSHCAFCRLHRCCFHHGNNIIPNNDKNHHKKCLKVILFFFSLEMAFRPGSQTGNVGRWEEILGPPLLTSDWESFCLHAAPITTRLMSFWWRAKVCTV